MRDEVDRKIEQAGLIEDEAKRSAAQQAICVELAEAGSFDRASALATAIGDPYARSWAFPAIACGQFNSGKMEEGLMSLESAKSAAELIGDGMQKMMTQAAIHATAAPQAGG